MSTGHSEVLSVYIRTCMMYICAGGSAYIYIAGEKREGYL